MRFSIKAYRSCDEQDGETIVIYKENHNRRSGIVACVADIDVIISKLTEAKEYALNASTEDEPLEIIFEL